MELAAVTDARSVAHSPGVQRLPNLKALTSVRFFAALYVALYHLVRPFDLWGPLAPLFSCGYVAVSFFFVLSGFILTYSHGFEYERGKGNPTKFYVARFARIYPVYLLTTLAAGWIMREQFAKPIHILAFFTDLVALQTWSIRTANFFNIPAWSISTEAFFYLVFPFVLIPLRPSSRRGAVVSVLAFWLLALVVPLYCLYRFPEISLVEFGPPGFATGATVLFWTRRLPILSLPEFLAGVALGWLYLHFRPGPRIAAVLAVVGICATLAALLLSNRLPFILLHNGLLLPVFAMAILGLSYDNLPARLLSNNVLVLLGEASFSLYLVHFLFNAAVSHWFADALTLRTASLKLAMIIPLSVLMHLAIERPCRRAILAFWSRLHPAQLVLSPAEHSAPRA